MFLTMRLKKIFLSRKLYGGSYPELAKLPQTRIGYAERTKRASYQMRIRSTLHKLSNFGSLLRDMIKPNRENVTMVVWSIFLLSYRHIILALLVASSCFGLPLNLFREK